MKQPINLEKEQLVLMRQQRDLLNDAINAFEHHIKETETPDPVVPWEPKGGDYVVLYTDRFFKTEDLAEQAAKFFTFYQRYYSLAMEMNEKYGDREDHVTPMGTVVTHHKDDPETRLYKVMMTQTRHWTPKSAKYRTLDLLFSKEEAAQEAADIMNRDGWELPTL